MRVKYCIQQEVFTIGDRFQILGEDGGPLLTAESELFSFGKKLHVFSVSDGREVLSIAQECFHIRPHYLLSIDGAPFGTLVSEFAFFTQMYTVEEQGWTVSGDFFAHDYKIEKDGTPIATIRKEWFTFGDCYTVEADGTANALGALAVTLAIDCIEAQK